MNMGTRGAILAGSKHLPRLKLLGRSVPPLQLGLPEQLGLCPTHCCVQPAAAALLPFLSGCEGYKIVQGGCTSAPLGPQLPWPP